MKTSILLIIIFILLKTPVEAFHSSPTDSILEIQLKLIQRTDGNSVKNTALSISLINHSNEDIYLPEFFIKTITNVYLYKKRNNQFVKIDLFGEGNDSKWEVSSDSIITVKESFSYQGNEITKILHKNAEKNYKYQDSIIQLLISLDSSRQYNWKDPFNKPLFIKANQTLDNLQVFNIEHILKKQADYRISFEFDQVETTNFPDEVLKYKKYIPKFIRSNTLYYSVIEN